MGLCNNLHAAGGLVLHCQVRTDQHVGFKHRASIAGAVWIWTDAGPVGARWTLRHSDAFLWHRVASSTATACGLDIYGLTTATIKGRTLAKPPVDGHVCPSCLAMTA